MSRLHEGFNFVVDTCKCKQFQGKAISIKKILYQIRQNDKVILIFLNFPREDFGWKLLAV